ncbi:MAG: AsmA-like C-terminal region-containing protein [Vampirovibrio sp.]|nr:AsmA-like C-terminal region-containing protein [Vampirovibrio sp.]
MINNLRRLLVWVGILGILVLGPIRWAMEYALPYFIDLNEIKAILKETVEEKLFPQEPVRLTLGEVHLNLTLFHGVEAAIETPTFEKIPIFYGDPGYDKLFAADDLKVHIAYIDLLALLGDSPTLKISDIVMDKPVGRVYLPELVHLIAQVPKQSKSGLSSETAGSRKAKRQANSLPTSASSSTKSAPQEVEIDFNNTALILKAYEAMLVLPNQKAPTLYHQVKLTGKKFEINLVPSVKFANRPVRVMTRGNLHYDLLQKHRVTVYQDLFQPLSLNQSIEKQVKAQLQADSHYNLNLVLLHIFEGRPMVRGALRLNEGAARLGGRHAMSGKSSPAISNSSATHQFLDRLAARIVFLGNSAVLDSIEGRLHGAKFDGANLLAIGFEDKSGKPSYKLPNGWRFNSEKLDLAKVQASVERAFRQLELPIPWPKGLYLGGTVKADRIGISDKEVEGSVLLLGVAARTLDQQLVQDVNGRFELIRRINSPKPVVKINALTGRFLKNPFTVDGKYSVATERVDLRVNAPQFNLTAMGNAHLTLLRFLKIPAKDLEEIKSFGFSGPLDVALNVSGPLEKPAISGSAKLQGVSVQDKTTRYQVDTLTGGVLIKEIDPLTIRLANIRGQMNSAPFQVDGLIRLEQPEPYYRVNVQANEVDLASLYQELKQEPHTAKTLTHPLVEELAGKASVFGVVQSQQKHLPSIEGDVSLTGLMAALKGTPHQLRVPMFKLTVDESGLASVPRTSGSFGPVNMSIWGTGNLKAFTKGNRQAPFSLQVETGEVPTSFLRENQPWLASITGEDLPAIWNTVGGFSFAGKLSEQGAQANITLADVGMSWAEGDFPVEQISGMVTMSLPAGGTPVIKTEGLRLYYGGSPILLTLEMNEKNRIAGEVTGTLSPLLLNHFVAQGRGDVLYYPTLPFRVDLSGSPGRIVEEGHRTIGTNLGMSLAVMVLQDIQPNIESTAQNRAEDSTPEEVAKAHEPAVLSVAVQLTDEALRLDDVRFSTVPNDDHPEIQAVVTDFHPRPNHPKEPVTPRYQVKFKTQEDTPLSLAYFQPYLTHTLFEKVSGAIEADLALTNRKSDHAILAGKARWSEVAAPAMNIRELSGKLDVAPYLHPEWNVALSPADLSISAFKIPGVDAALSANTHDLLTYPIHLKNVKINGDLFVLDAYNQFLENVVIQKIRMAFLDKVFQPWWQPPKMLPIEFHDADVRYKEVIFRNIILNDLTTKLTLFENSYTELKNTEFASAGGKVNATIFLDPLRNHFITLDLKAMHVKANALAVALLNVPNQIFGEIDGEIHITTQGLTDEMIMNNTNGSTTFQIANGRLPAIAKIETLLTAANILRGGVIGLNLNNILRVLKTYETNYFAELSGEFQIAQGVAYTNNLLSDGQDLDLVIEGGIRLQDGTANLVVNGSMSQDVSGILGPLGKLSVAHVTRYIPGLGFVPGTDTNLIKLIPGLGFIPGFGGPAQKFNRFQVKIEGPLDDPGSARDLRWIK